MSASYSFDRDVWYFGLGAIAEWIADDIPDDFDGVSGAIADALARGGGLC